MTASAFPMIARCALQQTRPKSRAVYDERRLVPPAHGHSGRLVTHFADRYGAPNLMLWTGRAHVPVLQFK